jgi:Sulfotransferase family
VAYGPEWPSEDDFALCNWSLASSLPGRMVVSEEAAAFERWHFLDGLTRRERLRWGRTQWAFVWKLRVASWLLGGPAGVLLKTPSHTAHVAELVKEFGAESLYFVHLTRSREAVMKSNVSMHERFEPYRLQDAPSAEAIQARIEVEHDRTLEAFERDAAALGLDASGRLVRMTFDDLIADPMRELRRAYATWGLAWQPEMEQRAAAYLESVRGYRTKDQKERHQAPGTGHQVKAAGGVISAMWSVVPAALCACALWLVAAHVTKNRLDWLVWPAGVLIGTMMMRAAPVAGGMQRRSTRWSGAAAALATVLVMLAVAMPATWWADYASRGEGFAQGTPIDWRGVWDSTRDGVLAINNAFWVFLGVMSAARLASRSQSMPPGAG